MVICDDNGLVDLIYNIFRKVLLYCNSIHLLGYYLKINLALQHLIKASHYHYVARCLVIRMLAKELMKLTSIASKACVVRESSSHFPQNRLQRF